MNCEKRSWSRLFWLCGQTMFAPPEITVVANRQILSGRRADQRRYCDSHQTGGRSCSSERF